MMEGSRPHPTRLSHCTVILANNQCLRHKNVATPLVIQREGHRGRQRLDKKKYNRNDLTPPSDQLWKSRGYLMMFQSRPRHYKVLLPMSKHRFLFYSPLGYCLSRRWQALPPPHHPEALALNKIPPTHTQPSCEGAGVGRRAMEPSGTHSAGSGARGHAGDWCGRPVQPFFSPHNVAFLSLSSFISQLWQAQKRLRGEPCLKLAYSSPPHNSRF